MENGWASDATIKILSAFGCRLSAFGFELGAFAFGFLGFGVFGLGDFTERRGIYSLAYAHGRGADSPMV